jgi:hypothetical protein
MEKPWLFFKNRKVLLNLDNWAKGKAEKGGDDILPYSPAAVNKLINLHPVIQFWVAGGSRW